MAAKLNSDSDQPIAEINIVPFVDIILVILIIFMLTTPFIVKPSINVQLPKAGAGDETSPSQLSVSITAAGELFLNGKSVTKEEVGKSAQELSVSKPDVQAIISADKDVPHGRVVEIIDAIKASGVKRFAITIDKAK